MMAFVGFAFATGYGGFTDVPKTNWENNDAPHGAVSLGEETAGVKSNIAAAPDISEIDS